MSSTGTADQDKTGARGTDQGDGEQDQGEHAIEHHDGSHQTGLLLISKA
jgi:hypothetical protein